MKEFVTNSIRCLVVLAPLCGCALTPDQEAWNRQHHVGQICWTCTPGEISSSPGQPDSPDYDPHPHSDSNDAQRAAYIQHQQEQLRQQNAPPPSAPDIGQMTCSGSSSVATGSNSGSMTSSTSCHN